jgi:SAM-dependent methyltransferase
VTAAEAAAPRSAYSRLVAIKRRLPEWLRWRVDPYNTAADRFVSSAASALPDGARVLDAGAGECRHRSVFARARYYGTDNGAGDELAWDYSQLSFRSDLAALPVRTGSMDAVVSVNVLEHVPEPGCVLQECRRVLRGQGMLYLVAPQSWGMHQAPQDYYRFTRYGLLRSLQNAGFETLHIEPVGGAFWNLGSRSLHLLTHFDGWKFPLALLLSPILGFLIPILCFYLDALDSRREDTLGYHVVARREADPRVVAAPTASSAALPSVTASP